MIPTTELKLSAMAKDVRKAKSDALVIAVGQGGDGPVLLENPLSAKSAQALADALPLLGVTGAADEAHRLPGLPESGTDVLVLAGVGKLQPGNAVTIETLRRAAGSAVRQLAGVQSVALGLPAATVAEAAAVAEGAALGAYAFNEHRSRSNDHRRPVAEATVLTPVAGDKQLAKALKRASVLGRAVNATRTLVNEPPSHLYPEIVRRRRQGPGQGPAGQGHGAGREAAWRRTATAASWASARAPRARRAWSRSSTPRPRPTAHLAFVGKGITFDSGGISLKPGAGMIDHEVRHGRRGRGARRRARRRRAGPPGQRHRLALPRREHALRHRHPSRRRAAHVRRQDRRGAQHRRRGPPGAGRRAGRGSRGDSPT